MADIQIQCPGCLKQVTASEFVNRSQLRCRTCGASFADAPADEAAPVRQDAAREREAPVPASLPLMEDAIPSTVIARVQTNRPKRFIMTNSIVSWILLLVLGGIALYIRFGGWLNVEHIEWIESNGPLILLAIHIYVVFKAFRDSVFQGVLCLLVPFYSIYYALVLSYDYTARALIAASLLGLGWDSLRVIIDQAGTILPAINDWLTSGV